MINEITHKKCTKCNKKKKVTEFAKDKQKSDGFRSSCKKCKKIVDAKYRKNNKEKRKISQKKYYRENSQILIEKSKKWYNENLCRAKYSRKKWHIENRDKTISNMKKYRIKNKDNLNSYHREYQKNRYRTNINYRIKTLINKRIRDYIRNKKLPTLEYLDMPMDEFKIWIEYQFEEDMTWDNMGTYWHYDHVIPCDSFNLKNEDEIFKCYNWTNLRPCIASENCSKSNKIIKKIIDLQEHKVNEFIKERYCF